MAGEPSWLYRSMLTSFWQGGLLSLCDRQKQLWWILLEERIKITVQLAQFAWVPGYLQQNLSVLAISAFPARFSCVYQLSGSFDPLLNRAARNKYLSLNGDTSQAWVFCPLKRTRTGIGGEIYGQPLTVSLRFATLSTLRFQHLLPLASLEKSGTPSHLLV